MMNQLKKDLRSEEGDKEEERDNFICSSKWKQFTDFPLASSNRY